MRILLSLILALLAPAARLSSVVVVNRGVPGETTAEIDARTASELRTYSPDVVVLFAGMNDAVNDKKFLPLDVSQQHIASIVRACRHAHAHVVLVTVHQPDIFRLLQRHTRAAYGDTSPEQRIRSLNAGIAAVAATDEVPTVDFNRMLEQQGSATARWSTDGVHLTAQGYALLAQGVAQQLKRMGNIHTVLCLGDSLTFGIGVRRADTPDTDESYPSQLRLLLSR